MFELRIQRVLNPDRRHRPEFVFLCLCCALSILPPSGGVEAGVWWGVGPMRGDIACYLDASGEEEWPSKRPIAGLRCIVAGVCVTGRQNEQAAQIVGNLQRDISDGFGRDFPELHFSEMLGGGGAFHHLGRTHRHHFGEVFIDRLLELRPALFGYVVNLESLREARGESISPCHYGLQANLSRANALARSQDARFRAVVDGGDPRKAAEVRRFVAGLKRPQSRLDGQRRPGTPSLDRLIDNADVQESHHSPGLQIADGVAWFLQAYVRRGDPRILRFRDLWKSESPLELPGAKRLFPLIDNRVIQRAEEILERRATAGIRPRPKPSKEGPKYVPPETPPPGARLKQDRFSWI